MRWTFFFLLSSLSLARILSLLFCSMLIHSISKKNERKRDSLARLPRATHIHTYIYSRRRQGEKEWPDSRSLYVCVCVPAVYIFSVPSGVMRKEQKANLDCSIQLNIVARCVLSEWYLGETVVDVWCASPDEETFLVLFSIKYQTKKEENEECEWRVWTVIGSNY